MSAGKEAKFPERELVDNDELREIINRALSENIATSNVEVVGSIRLCDEPYDDGGNWKRSIAIGGSPNDPQRCGEVAADIIEKIANDYNLKVGD